MASISLLQLCSKALEELKKDHKDKEMVVYTVRGVEAKYYHYLCDGEDDRGWGCGYRTLQSLCSWARNMSSANHSLYEASTSLVPSLRKIQELLVEVGDKSESFVGSHQWIGCYESSIVLDQLYGVSSRLLHVRSGGQVGEVFLQLEEHFKMVSAPVMIGGDRDAASKTLIGLAHHGGQGVKYLIADPHYCGHDDIESVFTDNAVKWYETEQLFAENSFYNFCLPIAKQQ